MHPLGASRQGPPLCGLIDVHTSCPFVLGPCGPNPGPVIVPYFEGTPHDRSEWITLRFLRTNGGSRQHLTVMPFGINPVLPFSQIPSTGELPGD
jgi:hypothetical protein